MTGADARRTLPSARKAALAAAPTAARAVARRAARASPRTAARALPRTVRRAVPRAAGRAASRAGVAVVAGAVSAAALAGTAGCGVRPTGVISAGDKPIADGQAAPLTVYLLRSGRLAPVVRPGLPGHPLLAITQLGVPVTSAERRDGLHSEVPSEAFLVVRRDEGSGKVLVDGGDARSGSRATWSRGALAQIACTAQAIPGVRGVLLSNIPATGVDTERLLRCEDFADLR